MVNIIKHDQDGVEFFTVESTGESGMSQTGLAKLCGVSQPAISKLLSSFNSITSDEENPLKAILEEALYLITWKSEKGRGVKIIRSAACVKIIRYYDRKGNKVAQSTLDKFAAMGIDTWIQKITGWQDPVKRGCTTESVSTHQASPITKRKEQLTLPPSFMEADLSTEEKQYQHLKELGKREIQRKFLYD